MVTFSEVTCPRCLEWRETMITVVIDPMGKRYYCGCCSHEFKAPCSPPAANTPRPRGTTPAERAAYRTRPETSPP
jgi:hypothetical protein